MVFGGVLDVKAPFSVVLTNGIVKKSSSKFKNHKNLGCLRLLEHFCSLFGIFLHTIAALNDMDILISYSGVRAWIFV